MRVLVQWQPLAMLTRWHWPVLYLAICLSWAALFRLGLPEGQLDGLLVYGLEFWLGLCSVDPLTAGYPTLMGMWMLMAIAMMLPTFLPAIAGYEQLPAAAGSRGAIELAAGFLAVWVTFALMMSAVQLRMAVLLPFPEQGWQMACLVLAAAGIYQFLPVKDACLARCRSPLMFFLAHWRHARLNEVLLGLRMGVVCAGCCWLLMSISLVAGAMSVLWMGVATIVMCLEKMPELGRLVSRPLGLALLSASAAIALAGS